MRYPVGHLIYRWIHLQQNWGISPRKTQCHSNHNQFVHTTILLENFHNNICANLGPSDNCPTNFLFSWRQYSSQGNHYPKLLYHLSNCALWNSREHTNHIENYLLAILDNFRGYPNLCWRMFANYIRLYQAKREKREIFNIKG